MAYDGVKMKYLIRLLTFVFVATVIATLSAIIVLMPLLVFNTWISWDGYNLSIILR